MKILVVEDEQDIRELINLFLESHFNAQVVQASSGNAGIRALKADPSIQCVISDYAMSDGTGGDLLKYIRSSGLKVPFVLCSAYDHHELMSLFPNAEVTGFIMKPYIIEPLKKIIEGLMLQEGPVIAEGGTEYSPVRVRTISKMGTLSFDLYIMLAAGKFVKVTKAGDAFDQKDLQRFDDKSVEYLYMRRSDSASLMEGLSRRIDEIIENEVSSDAEIIEFTTSSIELISALEPMVRFPAEAQDLVHKSAKLSLKTIRTNRRLDEIFSEFIRGSTAKYLPAHSVALSHLACGIACQMGWKSETTFFKLTLAAYLHDITLKNEALARLQAISDLSLRRDSFSDSDVAAYLSHPTDAANLVQQIREIPPDVPTIVLQHHERPDGTGFPKQIDWQKIDPLSAVLIVAHELYSYYMDHGADGGAGPFIAALGPSFRRGIFGQILAAMMK